jgi:hypothetical protein
MQYSINGNILIVGNVTHSFQFSIDSYLEIEGMVVVLLEIPPKVRYNENVFGVSLLDNHVWQITKIEHYPDYKQMCPFVGLGLKDGNLRLNNWCDKYFIVDPWTGKILEEGISR